MSAENLSQKLVLDWIRYVAPRQTLSGSVEISSPFIVDVSALDLHPEASNKGPILELQHQLSEKRNVRIEPDDRGGLRLSAVNIEAGTLYTYGSVNIRSKFLPKEYRVPEDASICVRSSGKSL